MQSSTKTLGLLVVVLGAVVAFASWLLWGNDSKFDASAQHGAATARSEPATNAPAEAASAPSSAQRSELANSPATPAPAVVESNVPTADHVSGVVVDATGRPIANAAVSFGPSGSPFGGRRPPRVRGFNFNFGTPTQPDPVTTRTATDGTFTLTKVPRVEGLELRVDHPDYVLLVRNDLIVPTNGLDVGRIQLEAGGSVAGQVFGPDGAKLAAAEVSLRDTGDAAPTPGRFLNFRFGTRGERKAVTDAEGHFKLTGMPKGRALVAATHEAMLEATSSPIEVVPMQEVGGVTLTLERGQTVNGVVHDSVGKPIAGATIHADAGGDGFARFQRFTSGAEPEIKSGAEGRFQIPGLKPGVYEVSAEAAGYAPKSVAGVDASSSVPVEVVLGASAHVAGKVRIKGTSEPVHNVKVQLVPNWGDTNFIPTLDVADSENKATADGEFLIPDVDPNSYRVAARGDGTARGLSDPIQVTEGTSVDGVEIEVERGAIVAGRVFDPTGAPLANVDVVCSVQRAPPNNAAQGPGRQFRVSSRMFRGFGGGRGRFDPTRQVVGRAKSDKDGRFQVEQLAAGTYTIDATHADFADARVDAVEVATAATKEGVEIHMTRGGAVEGAVTGLDGKPRAGDRVEVDSKVLEGVSKSAVSDANGFFRVEHVPAGEAVATRFEADTNNGGGLGGIVFVAGNGTESDAGKHVVVVEGETVRVDFSQVEKPYVEGVVTCADGAVGGAIVSANPDFSQGRPFSFGAQKQAVTSSDGRFRLADLDPGVWNLSVRHPQGLVAVSAQVTLEVGAGARHDFMLEGGVVEGDVTAQMDKSKLEGATVSLQRTDGGGGGGATSVTGAIELAVAGRRGGGARPYRFGFGGDGGGRVTTDRTGHFRAPWVPAGKYRVSARRNGFLETQSDEFEITSNGHVEHVDVALPAAAMLHVTVRSKATGLVLANCAVQVESDTGESDWRTTDPDGVARFDSLKPGTWSVNARRSFDSEEGTKRSTACEAGHTAEITVDL